MSLLKISEEMANLMGWLDVEGQFTYQPPLDIIDNKDSYLVQMELPGVYKKDISISIEKNRLIIKGEKKNCQCTKDNFTTNERLFGKFSKYIKLSDDVILKDIRAAFEDGLLMITLPKKEEAKPRTIVIS